MINPLSRISVMDWAVICFEAVADFTNPAPAFSITPLESRTRGARFSELIEPAPGILVVRYELDIACDEAERIELSSVHVQGLVELAPFVPIALSKPADPPLVDGDRFFDAVVIAQDPSPPQGSPPSVLGFRYLLRRAIPV
jgi:hypothetical protein